MSYGNMLSIWQPMSGWTPHLYAEVNAEREEQTEGKVEAEMCRKALAGESQKI